MLHFGQLALIERARCVQGLETIEIDADEEKPPVPSRFGHGSGRGAHLLMGAAPIVTNVCFHGAPFPMKRDPSPSR
jgi:hypothetical protein